MVTPTKEILDQNLIRVRDRQGEVGRMAGHTAADDREGSQAWQREGTRDAGLVTPGRGKPQDPQAEACRLFLPTSPVLCPLSLGAEPKLGEP